MLGTVVLSRLLVWGAALAAIAIFGENEVARHTLDPSGVTAPFHSGVLNTLVAPAARWDSAWYLQIAAHGYYSPASSNFFPLYPLLVHVVEPVFGSMMFAGIAISLTAMVGALLLLDRLVRLDLGEDAARLTLLLVAAYPMSVFLSAVYTESLFLLLTVACIYAARRERWALAGLCGGLATATRSDGLALLVPLILLYLYGPRARTPTRTAAAWWVPRFRLQRSVLWLALVPAGIAGYMLYLAIAHGAPLAPFHAAAVDWGRSFGGPFSGLVRVLGALPGDLHGLVQGTARSVGPGDPVSWNAHDLIDLGFVFVGFASWVASWRRVPLPYLAYAAVMLIYATSFPAPNSPLQAAPRYLLPIFPLFMGVASRLASRPVASRLVLAGSGLLLILMSGLWGYWALLP